jgi:hypothetical protein
VAVGLTVMVSPFSGIVMPVNPPAPVTEVAFAIAMVSVDEPPAVMLAGFAVIVAVGGCAAAGLIVNVAVPDFVVSCVEVAVIVAVVIAVIVEDEAKAPEDEMLPAPEGLTLHVTAEL